MGSGDWKKNRVLECIPTFYKHKIESYVQAVICEFYCNHIAKAYNRYTKGKKKEFKHNTIENCQITRAESKRREESRTT